MGAGSYLRLTDSCITQLKAQGPARTSNESKEEEDGARNLHVAFHVKETEASPVVCPRGSEAGSYLMLIDFVYHSTLGLRVGLVTCM